MLCYTIYLVILFSGVTIGIGVDLKETTRKYFRDIGVSEAVIDKLAPYFGLEVKIHSAILKIYFPQKDSDDNTDKNPNDQTIKVYSSQIF